MIRYLSLLLLVGLAWGQDSSVYIPKIDLFGFDISTWYILGWLNIFFGKIAMYIIPRERAIEIDDLVDYQIAEVLFSK